MSKKILIFLLILIFSLSKSFTKTNNISIPVLCYHHISTDNKTTFSSSSYAVTKAQFESQMKYLADNGFKTISLNELYRFLQGENVNIPDRPVVITFDDGLKSHLEIAIPVLKKYDFKGVFFIYPSVIISKNKSIRKWHLTKDELLKLHNSGGDIQSHSYYHPLMHRENDKTNKNQFSLSKKWLEEKIGKKIEYFAYPFGSYTKNIMELGLKAGYKGLFTINNGSVYKNTNPLSINRFMVTRSYNLKTFSKYINSRPLKLKNINNYDGVSLNKIEQVKVILIDNLKLKDYKINIHLNGSPVKNIKYNEKTGELIFTAKKYLAGLNMIQIIFQNKKNKNQAFINGWTFIYKPGNGNYS